MAAVRAPVPALGESGGIALSGGVLTRLFTGGGFFSQLGFACVGRVVALGASNLTRGFPSLCSSARDFEK